MTRIICIGNRYAPHDAAGMLVYEQLVRGPLPPDVEVIDGGLAGLDLLGYADGTERVVFVDAVCGFGEPGNVVVLDADEAAGSDGAAFGHGGGLHYLLRALPYVCEDRLPDIRVVGVEGPAEPSTIAAATRTCLMLAEQRVHPSDLAAVGAAGERG